jgi:hypothetical protein
MAYHNSTIRARIGICVDCPAGSEPQEVTGKRDDQRCHNHYWSHLRLKSAQKTGIAAPTKENLYDRKPAKKQPIEGLGQWFRDRREEMTGACMETGVKTAKFNDAFFVFSIAHILPKEHFPSIATHPLNWMELSIESHTKYDRNWMTATKMKCFAIAKERFKQFEHLIAQEERKRIPPQFLQL